MALRTFTETPGQPSQRISFSTQISTPPDLVESCCIAVLQLFSVWFPHDVTAEYLLMIGAFSPIATFHTVFGNELFLRFIWGDREACEARSNPDDDNVVSMNDVSGLCCKSRHS